MVGADPVSASAACTFAANRFEASMLPRHLTISNRFVAFADPCIRKFNACSPIAMITFLG